MKVIELDGKDFIDFEHTHNVLKSKLELPEYYGKNLDALWDCLTGWLDVPVQIKWKNYNDSYSKLGRYAEELRNVFKEASEEMDELVFEIEI